MSGYAMSLSYSLVDDEDGVQAGFHAQSTDGIDIDVQAEGDDREEVMKAVINEVIEETINQTLYNQQQLEETTDGEPDSLETLQIENEQLRDEVAYLRNLLGETEEEDEDTTSIFDMMLNNHICDCKDDKGNHDSLEDFLSAYNMDLLAKFFNIY